MENNYKIDYIKNEAGDTIKRLSSENYNYRFNMVTGEFLRYGKTLKDDPAYSPFGPEIVDGELGTICHGITKSDGTGGPCPWCYKSNTPNGKNMTFETFKILFSKFPDTITQLAAALGDIDANPDLFKILWHCRLNGVIPNLTLNGARLTIGLVEELAKVLGACSVSNYDDDVCFDAVEALSAYKNVPGYTIRQINIHSLLSHENYNDCLALLKKTKTDKRLANLNSVVFLYVKPKGDRNTMHPVTTEQFNALVKIALDENVSIGFDSCSASAFLTSVKEHPKYKLFETLCEPCESFGLFSSYFNVDGKYFPCSFAERTPDWEDGIDLLDIIDFNKDVWNCDKIKEYRKLSLNTCDCNGCRRCLIYDLNQ